jgi:FMN reductase
MINVVILVGNPKPQSRTARIASLLAEQFLAGHEFSTHVIDLSEHADRLFQWPSPEMAALSRQVAEADLLIVASPTYKAAYSGLLKAFLDRYPANGLQGVVALPLMTGADQTHSMAPVATLLPLLLELGAVVPSNGLFFNIGQYHRIESLVADASAALMARLQSLRTLMAVLPPVGVSIGGGAA